MPRGTQNQNSPRWGPGGWGLGLCLCRSEGWNAPPPGLRAVLWTGALGNGACPGGGPGWGQILVSGPKQTNKQKTASSRPMGATEGPKRSIRTPFVVGSGLDPVGTGHGGGSAPVGPCIVGRRRPVGAPGGQPCAISSSRVGPEARSLPRVRGPHCVGSLAFPRGTHRTWLGAVRTFRAGDAAFGYPVAGCPSPLRSGGCCWKARPTLGPRLGQVPRPADAAR